MLTLKGALNDFGLMLLVVFSIPFVIIVLFTPVVLFVRLLVEIAGRF